MRVRVNKEFLWAPDGNNVRTVCVGDELDGEGARVALIHGEATPLDPPEEKAREAASENKAARPSRNKAAQ
jgi:hypothetical protein